MAETPVGSAYEDVKDEALVPLARTQDGAMSVLISRMQPLVSARAAAYRCGPLEQEDLMQEGMFGFLSAVYAYQPDCGASFRTYAGVCIGNRIASAVRAVSRRKHQPLNTYLPLDEAEFSGPSFSPEEQLIAQEESGRFYRMLDEQLSSFEREVLLSHLAGHSYEQTAAQLKSTAKSVDNALQRVRRKLRLMQQSV